MLEDLLCGPCIGLRLHSLRKNPRPQTNKNPFWGPGQVHPTARSTRSCRPNLNIIRTSAWPRVTTRTDLGNPPRLLYQGPTSVCPERRPSGARRVEWVPKLAFKSTALYPLRAVLRALPPAELFKELQVRGNYSLDCPDSMSRNNATNSSGSRDSRCMVSPVRGCANSSSAA